MSTQRGSKYLAYILITALIIVCTYGCAPENVNIESPNSQDNASSNGTDTESKLTYEDSSEQKSSTGMPEPDISDSSVDETSKQAPADGPVDEFSEQVPSENSVDAASEQDSRDSSVDAVSEPEPEVKITVAQIDWGYIIKATVFTDKETVDRILSYVDEFTEIPYIHPADGAMLLSIEITTDEGTTLYYIYPQNYAILFQGDEETWYSMPDETFLYAAKLIGVDFGYSHNW